MPDNSTQNVLTILSGAIGLKILEFSFGFIQKLFDGRKESEKTVEDRINKTMLERITQLTDEIEAEKVRTDKVEVERDKYREDYFILRGTALDQITELKEAKNGLTNELAAMTWKLHQAEAKLKLYEDLKEKIEKGELT